MTPQVEEGPQPEDWRFPHGPVRYGAPLEEGETFRLDGRIGEMLRFRQVNVKEAFTLQDRRGQFFRASLKELDRNGGSALAYERMPRSPESPLYLTLLCAVLARQRMLVVMQKATELGVARIQPVFTDASVGPEGLVHEKAHAWPGAILRACKQCRRTTVPELLPPVALPRALESDWWKAADARPYLDDRSGEGGNLPEAASRVCLGVGPEGGWTEAEREALAAAGGIPLLLGGRVLRAETAVLAGLAVVQHRLGDLR